MRYTINTIRLDTPERKELAINTIKSLPDEPVKMVKFVNSDTRRSLAANAYMWVMLGQLAKRGKWHSATLKAEEWKDLLTAGLEQQRLIPGIEGGFVALGQRTSKMSVKKMSELIEFMYYFVASGTDGLDFSGFINEVADEYKPFMEIKNDK